MKCKAEKEKEGIYREDFFWGREENGEGKGGKYLAEEKKNGEGNKGKM